MVSDWSDAGAERWLADKGIDVLRGTGRLAGTGAVEVDGVTYTAEHVVLANGADPVVPPVPGLRELEGVWGTREATSLKEVPRRLVVRGGMAPTTSSSSATVASCAASACSSPPGGARGSRASASRPSASSPTRAGSRSTPRCA